MTPQETRWARWTLAVIAVAALYRLLFIFQFPLGPDEASYWTWAQRLDFGYVDHPPLVAYAIRLANVLLGEHDWSSRIFACVLAGVASWLLYKAGTELFDARVGFWAATLHATCPMFGMAAGIMLLPECLLTVFMGLALYLAARLLHTGRLGVFLPLGVVLGLALLSKYPGILVLLGLGLFALLSRRHRHWFWRWQPYAMAAIGLAMFAPVIVWNIRHHAAGLTFVSERTSPGRLTNPLLLLAESVFGQAAYHSPVTFALLIYGVIAAGMRAWRGRDERALLVFCYSGPVLLAFFAISMVRYTLPHWPAAGYLAAYVAAPAALWGFPGHDAATASSARGPRRWLLAAAAVGAACSVLLPICMVTPITKSALYLRLARIMPALGEAPEPMAQGYGWDGVIRAQAAAYCERLRAAGRDPVVLTHDHLQASLLAHGLRGACPVISLGPRAWQFAIWYGDADVAGKSIVYVSSDMSEGFRGSPDEHFRFDSCEAEPDLPIVVNGHTINVVHFWLCEGYRGVK